MYDVPVTWHVAAFKQGFEEQGFESFFIKFFFSFKIIIFFFLSGIEISVFYSFHIIHSFSIKDFNIMKSSRKSFNFKTLLIFKEATKILNNLKAFPKTVLF